MTRTTDITVKWSKREGDLSYRWEAGSRPTAMFVADCFERTETYTGKTLAQELEARGYDLKTLRFSIRRTGGTSP